MENWDEFADALLSEELYGSEVPAARSDAQVTILSLPTELLHLIVGHCKNKAVLSLMRTNHVFHNVALCKFYANLHLAGQSFETKLHSLDPKIPFDDLLLTLQKKKYGMLGGLLQSKQHIAVVQSLRVVNYPSPLGPAHTVFNKILRYIIANAHSMTSLDLPFAILTQSNPLFEGLTAPSSLSHVTTQMSRGDLIGSILRTAQLRSLKVTFQCASFEEWQVIISGMSQSLRHLECFFHVQEGAWDESMEKIKTFTALLPRLESMVVGYCNCDGTETAYPDIPISSYCKFAAGLPSLTSMVVVDRGHGSFQNREAQKKEAALVTAIAEANSQIREIGVEYMFRTYNLDEQVKRIIWRAAKPHEAELSRDAKGQLCSWTPAPNLKSRLFWWHDTFGSSDDVYRVMQLRWGGTGRVIYSPSMMAKSMNVMRSLQILSGFGAH